MMEAVLWVAAGVVIVLVVVAWVRVRESAEKRRAYRIAAALIEGLND